MAPVSLRVNPEITVDAAHQYIRTGERGHKFGIPFDEVLHVAEVARMLKAIHAQESRKSAQAKAIEVVARLKEMKLRTAAELVEQKVGETLTYYTYPSTHWRQIRTNNPLERIIREIRRRTRAVGAFPDGHSALMLVAARLRHIASTKWGKRRYMVMDPLLNPAKQEVAA